MSRKEYVTRVDYLSWLIEECGLSRDEAEKEVSAALALPNGIRRRGYYRDEHRIHEMEHGEPDPGPGPSAPHLPFRLRWLENNLYSAIEYATEDLDRRTRHLRHLRHPPPKRRTKPDQDLLNRELLDLVRRIGRLKQSDNRAMSLLKGVGATTRQIRSAFWSLPAELRFGVGEK